MLPLGQALFWAWLFHSHSDSTRRCYYFYFIHGETGSWWDEEKWLAQGCPGWNQDSWVLVLLCCFLSASLIPFPWPGVCWGWGIWTWGLTTPFGSLSSSHLHPSHSSSTPQRVEFLSLKGVKCKKTEAGSPARVLVASILGLSFPIRIVGMITYKWSFIFIYQTCRECLLNDRHCYRHFININSFSPSNNSM